jgi:hypothetical protein
MRNGKRGGDDIANCPPSPLRFESLPVPGTPEKLRVLRALQHLHRDSHGKRAITAELLEFMTKIPAAECRKLVGELVRDGYAEAADGGWIWTGKNYP